MASRRRIYISSTFLDLQAHRAAVVAALEGVYDVESMERYAASDQRPLDKCLADVEACDGYVLIVAHREGFVPKLPGEAPRSITEREYDAATKAGKPRFVFVVERQYPWPKRWVDGARSAAGRRLSLLRGRLELAHVVGSFTDPASLAIAVLRAVSRHQWEAAHPAMLLGGSATAPPASTAPSLYATAFSRRRQLFLDHYRAEHEGAFRFAGRGRERAQLDDWLRSADPAMLLLTAPAGRGKSTLVTHWLGSCAASARTIVVPVSIRFGTNAFPEWTRALHDELSLALTGTIDNARPAVTDDHFVGPIHHLLRRPAIDGNVLLVLDGVDESTHRELLRELIPSELGAGLKILVTARDTIGGRHSTRSEWFDGLGLVDGSSTRWMQLAKLGLEEIAASLPQGWGAPDDAARARLARTLWQCCDDGDPLLLGLVLAELQRGKVLAGSMTVDEVARLTRGYRGVVDRWIDEQARLVSVRREGPASEVRLAMARLLALLAHARGPIRAAELLALFRIAYAQSAPADPSDLEALDRLVIANADGLVLCHTRIADYVLSTDFADESITVPAGSSFVTWSATLAARLASAASAGRELAEPVSDYQLRWAVDHALSDAASKHEMLAPFLGHRWLRAREALDEGTHGFSRDAAAIRRFLRRRDIAPDEQAHESQLAIEFACSLILSSTRRFVGMPPKLLVRHVRTGGVSEKALLDLLVGMPAEVLAPYLAALQPHLSPSALSAIRAALVSVPKEPADHLCLVATVQGEEPLRDFDRAFEFLRAHRFGMLNYEIAFAAGLCGGAASANSEAFYAHAIKLASLQIFIAEELVEGIIATIPSAVLSRLEAPLFDALVLDTRWRRAAVWKRALARAPRDVVQTWKARAAMSRGSQGASTLIALACIGAWEDGEARAGTFSLLADALPVGAPEEATFDMEVLRAIAQGTVEPFLHSRDLSTDRDRHGDLACVAACFLPDADVDLVEAHLDRPMASWQFADVIEIALARRPAMALPRVESWRRREMTDQDRASIFAALAASTHPQVIRQCVDALPGLGGWRFSVIEALAANEALDDIDRLIRLARRSDDAAQVFAGVLRSTGRLGPNAVDRFARTVRSAADANGDSKLSLALRSISLSARRRLLPADAYSTELMRLVIESIAEGCFSETIMRHHWLDDSHVAAILRTNGIHEPELRLRLAARAVCGNPQAPDTPARSEVLQALSAELSRCIEPPFSFTRHVGLSHLATQLIESGPESTLAEALRLVKFIASDCNRTEACANGPVGAVLGRIAARVPKSSPLTSILEVAGRLADWSALDFGIAICQRLGPALSGELLDLVEAIDRPQGIAWAIRDGIDAIDLSDHRRVLRIAEGVGNGSFMFADETYAAEILSTLWRVADAELRQEIESRVLDLAPGLPLSTGLACIRVPAAREFRSGELERLYRSFDGMEDLSRKVTMHGSPDDAIVVLLGQALSGCGDAWPIAGCRHLLDRCAFVSRDAAVAALFGLHLTDVQHGEFVDRLAEVLEMLP